MAAHVSPLTVWRWGSGFAFLLLLLIGISYPKSFRSFTREELQASGSSGPMFYTGATIGTAITLLQLYNVVVPGTFWPFFTVIVSLIVGAMVEFIVLVLAGQQAGC